MKNIVKKTGAIENIEKIGFENKFNVERVKNIKGRKTRVTKIAIR